MPHNADDRETHKAGRQISRRNVLIGGAAIVAAATLPTVAVASSAKAVTSTSPNQTQMRSNMKNMLLFLIMLTITAIPPTRPSNAEEEKPFAPNVVDAATGALRVPENYREWPMLGVWAHPEELHIVYTQPETVTYYKKNGEYPDGAVLVKELLNVETMSMKTGLAVSHATTLKSWFVMVRDTKGRYKESKLWGDGWAWSHFKGRDSAHTVSEDYKKNCIPCHVPARDLARPDAADADKWIYTFGYPVLRDK